MPFNTLLSYQTDLARGVTRTPIRPALLTQDSQAHTIRVACVRAGSAESLNGAAVRGYFIRADGVTVPLDGSVDGNAACVTLTQACYAVPGRFQLVMKASLGGTVATLFFGDGAVAVSQTDVISDNERIIPSLEELLRQIDAMEEATAAASQVANLQVTATTLSPGAQATAAYAGGVLSLGIPRGDVGQVGAPGGGAPHNWLDNSDMTNAINQRGASSYTGQVYGIDRWRGRAVAQTVSVRSADVTVTATGTSYAGIKQKVHGMPRLAGKTVTFAARLYANVVPELVLFDASEQSLAVKLGTAGATQTLILTYAVPTDATADSVVPTILIRTSASGDYMRIVWAALYEGSYTADTLPAYQPKGFAEELDACEMDCQIIPFHFSMYNVATDSSYPSRYQVTFPRTMRIAPTAVFEENWSSNIKSVDQSNVSKKALCFTVSANSTGYTEWHGSIRLSCEP